MTGNAPGADWTRLDLYGPDVAVWRSREGRFRVKTVGGATLEFGVEERDAIEAVLLALVDAKRELFGEDFVPGKALRAAPSADPGLAMVRFEPEDLEYLRTLVRVGKEESLDAAIARAVKSYMRDRLARDITDADDAPAAPRARSGQRSLFQPEGPALQGVGVIQRQLLKKAAERGYVTRLDVGRAYGITAAKRNASGARVKAEAAVNALVARGLLRPEVVDAETRWFLTENGRAFVETDLAR